MTKEEVLQKVTDYCNEKSYTSATLTDAFKDKFADHFQKADPDGDINDENVLKSLKFALNTAFSSASELATVKVAEFTSKENDLKGQIAELKKKIPATPKVEPTIPQEVQDQLNELKAFKDAKSKQEKLANIMTLAKAEIRRDLHKSFDTFAGEYEVKLDKEDKEQANALVRKFQEIFKDSIGDIKPLAPQVSQKRDEEALAAIPKVKV